MASQVARPPFMNAIKPNLTEKETQHLMKQKKLVSLLIQYGIGLGASGANGAKLPLADATATRSRSPPLGNAFAYGPTASPQMIKEQRGAIAKRRTQ